MKPHSKFTFIGFVAMALAVAATMVRAQDALPSWNDGPAKKAIVEFVQATTTQGSPRFVPPPERVATFDQDGTLWVEQPMDSLLQLAHPPRLHAFPAARPVSFVRKEMTTMPEVPLPSWNDGPARSAIVDLVARVAKEGGKDYVPPAERIATFDNDGTLWNEHPMLVQGFFLADRIKQLAAKDPSIKQRQPFKAFVEHDFKTLQSLGKQGLAELVFATHAGMSDEEFADIGRGLLPRSTRNTAARSRRWRSGRSSSCSVTCGRTASRRTSSRAAASISCA